MKMPNYLDSKVHKKNMKKDHPEVAEVAEEATEVEAKEEAEVAKEEAAKLVAEVQDNNS